MKNLLAKIGLFFTHLFEGAQHAWNHLSPDIQDAITYGSGVVTFINDNIDKAPQVIIDLILSKFPNMDQQHLHLALQSATADLKIASDINNVDLLTTVENIQKLLASKTGSTWAKISKTIAEGIALFTAPQGTAFDIISSIITWAYQTFFKKA